MTHAKPTSMHLEYKDFGDIPEKAVFRSRGKWWQKSSSTNEAYHYLGNKTQKGGRVISTFLKDSIVAVIIN